MDNLNFQNDNHEQMGGFDLLPDKTLAYGIIKIRPYNAGLGIIEKTTDWGGKFLDLEISIIQGPFKGRKVFHNLPYFSGPNATEGQVGWVNGGRAGIRAILEVNGAGPSNPQGYDLASMGGITGLDGKLCAFRIGVEKGKPYTDGQGQRRDGVDKNTIRCFFTPNPESKEHKYWTQIQQEQGQPGQQQAPQRQQAPQQGQMMQNQQAQPQGQQMQQQPQQNVPGQGNPPGFMQQGNQQQGQTMGQGSQGNQQYQQGGEEDLGPAFPSEASGMDDVPFDGAGGQQQG